MRGIYDRIKRCRMRTAGVLFFGTVLSLAACAPITLYSVDLKYEPSKTSSVEGKPANPVPVTVAVFNDARQLEDVLMIGKVVTPEGSSIPVFPKYRKPAEAVTAGVKDYLQRAGYAVSKESPEWSLHEKEIRREWGKILVGGSIDEMEVVCRQSIPMKNYEAKVRLSVLFADVEKGFVFYKTTVESSASREDIRFSEEELGRQASGALSEVIEKAFENKSLKQKIQDMGR